MKADRNLNSVETDYKHGIQSTEFKEPKMIVSIHIKF